MDYPRLLLWSNHVIPILLSSFVINSLGYQWAWTSNLNIIGYTSYIDHYIISSNLIKAFHYLFYLFNISSFNLFYNSNFESLLFFININYYYSIIIYIIYLLISPIILFISNLI